LKYCSKCLQPDTRPNTKFSSDGVCPACSYAETLSTVDWDQRQSELKEIVSYGRSHSNSIYDCIIGVSGGKDSTRQALYVKEQLGMNPLLVCLNYPPQQVTQRGVDNLSNLIALGFDTVMIQPSPVIWRDLMRKGFYEYGNWAKSTEYALFSSVPRLAIAYQIPLIWWGENPALQLGDMKTLGNHGGDGNNLKYMNTLGGGDITWLLDEKIRKNNILQYIYPPDEDMQKAKLRIIYLGYYWEVWSLLDNALFATARGLKVRDPLPRETGDLYGVTSLDEDWVTLNQMIKYLKYGFGRITDYVNEDVRRGRMTREKGIELVEKYDGSCGDQYIESFCQYIDISKDEFWKVVDSYVNKNLFEKDASGRWIKKFKVGQGL
jgi:N-acetyl sugar amidotransferase